MPLDKPQNIPNSSLSTPYITVNSDVAELGNTIATFYSGTTDQRPTINLVIGDQFYNTQLKQLELYTENGWVADSTAPQAPTNVTVSNAPIIYGGTPAALIKWVNATSGAPAASYTVTSTPGSLTATVSQPGATITGLTAGTSYTFTVTATNTYGSATSAPSGSLTAGTAPQAPTVGTPALSGTGASVPFTANGTGGPAITAYTVYASGGQGISASGTSSPIIVNGLTQGNSYTFTVSATNSVGESPKSTPSSSLTIQVPLTVQYLMVGGGGGSGGPGNRSFANSSAWAGGGGAGGYVADTADLSLNGSYPIVIGGGGGVDTSGTSTTFNGRTALGGGRGGNSDSATLQPGASGGSGGGGGGDVPNSGNNSAPGGATTQFSTYGYGNGNIGGFGLDPAPERGGGGGGAGAAGSTGLLGSAGGNGLQWLDGNYYAGGGGGGAGTAGTTTNTGGLGGGGNGTTNAYNVASNAQNGTANKGGGGGGGPASGGNGVAIIRYTGSTVKASGGLITQSGGYTYHTFNSNGTFLVGGTTPVVTTGLQLYLDTTNSFSYPGSGSTWFDISGNSRNISLSNTTYGTANGVTALIFNGSNASGTLGANLISNPSTAQYTVSVWTNQAAYSPDPQEWVSQWFAGGSGNSFFFGPRTWSGGNASIYVGDGTAWASQSVPLNTWVHWTVIQDAAGNASRLYRNGALAASSTKATPTSSGTFNIGIQGSAGEFYNGRMAQVLVYNRVLTGDEISSNFTAERSKYGV